MNELVSSILHLGGAGAVALAAPRLLKQLGSAREMQAAGLLYVVCVVQLLLASGCYHLAGQLLGEHDALTLLLVRIDHAAVWLIYAGFFVLPYLIEERGAWRWAPLAVVWTAAFLGIASKALSYTAQSPLEVVLPYALASLIGVASTIRFVSRRGTRAAAPLFVFWVAFTGGAACFVFRWPNPIDGWFGSHEVWHVGVLLGIYAHWRFVLQLAPDAKHAFPVAEDAGALAPVPVDVRRP